MKDVKFRQDVINTQLKIAQLQALICAEGKIEEVKFKDRFGNTITRYRDMATGFLTSNPGSKSSESVSTSDTETSKELTKEEAEKRRQETIDKAIAQMEYEINHPKRWGDETAVEVDFSTGEVRVVEIKEAGPMGVDIPKALNDAKKKIGAGAEKAIADIASGSYIDAIKKDAKYLSKNVSAALALEVAKIEALGFVADVAYAADKSGIANLTPGQKIAVGIRRGARDVVDAAKNLSADPLIRAANYGKDRIASIKEVVEEEKARKQKGLPPMSAEQQANLASYKFHQKRAADNYSWNPLARNNARFVSEKVAAAKASMGKSPDTVDKLLHDMGMATDKTKQIAESFKKRISEITPENYKEKLKEFAADCNVKPKGDPMAEVAQFLHAGGAMLSMVGGVAGPETAIALAAAPLAPALMGELAAGMIGSNVTSLGASAVAMGSGWGEEAEKSAGAIAYSTASYLVMGGPMKKVGEKLASTAAQKGTQLAPEAKAAYSSAKSAIAKAAKSEPAKKVSAAMQDALRKLGLSPKLAELPPEQASKVIQKAYSSKVAKAEKAIMKGGMKSRKPKLGTKKGFAASPAPASAPAPAQVEMGAHDLNQSFSYLMKAIGL